jgi:opacity protein-like surface antigen
MRIILLTLLLSTSLSVMAQNTIKPMYAQVLVGELRLSDETVTVTHDDVNFEGQLDDLPYLGAAAQVILQDGLFGYGWEAGAFVSWRNDDVEYAAQSGPGGTTVSIRVDNLFWSFETFMGLYVDIKPIDRRRLYISGGPLILFGKADIEGPDEDSLSTAYNGTIVINNGKNSDSDISAGYYGRAGIEARLTGNSWVGLSVRYMDADLDLSKSLGDFDIKGNLYLLSVTTRY